MPYSTVLFDLDHTLLDSDESERLAFAATLGEFGVHEPETHLDEYQQINGSLWKDVERGERSPNEVKTLRFERLFRRLAVDADPAEVGERYTEALGAHGELFAGVRAMLDEVGRFARLALITNGIGAVQRARIARLGLGTYLSAVAISGELGVAKPNPAIFDHLLGELGSPDVTTTVIVGDSLTSDIAGGHNAGISTCWFNPSGASGEEHPKPTHEVRQIADIPATLSAS